MMSPVGATTTGALTVAATAAAAMALATWATAKMRAGTILGRARNQPPARVADLRTGDLVLFRWHTVPAVHDLVSAFTHVGLVVHGPGGAYLLETHMRGDGKDMGSARGGVHMYPLARRVGLYRGSVFALRLRPGASRPDAARLWSMLPGVHDVPFPARYARLFARRCVMGLGGGDAGVWKRGMFCSELVAAVLRATGTLSAAHDVSCTTPESFVGATGPDGTLVFGPPTRLARN